MDWLGKLIQLPQEFLNSSDGPGGGVIQVLYLAGRLIDVNIIYICFSKIGSQKHCIYFSFEP
jgi:hypothetical protein